MSTRNFGFRSMRVKPTLPDPNETSPTTTPPLQEKTIVFLEPNGQHKNQKKSIFNLFSKSPAPATAVVVEPRIHTNQNLFPKAAMDQDIVKLFMDIEMKWSHLFEKAEIEFSNQEMRMKMTFETQKATYQWQLPGSTLPSYPPCLKSIPLYDQTPLLKIFNAERFLDTAVALLPEEPPVLSAFLYGDPTGSTMVGLEARMERLRREHKNIGKEASIANRADWYSDAVFAQQSFTGTNPATLCNASKDWVNKFGTAAKRQGRYDIQQLLKNCRPASLFIQDCSYFRNAANASADSTLMSDDHKRYGCASVTLYQLSTDGALHPLAIIIDYRASMENSVCIFNQRISPSDSSRTEALDWPWRYAKMCAQVSDWTRHELQIHLNDCHFVEEATIVAAQRSLPSDHIIHQILQPHWLKTLSLNAAARATLMPKVIVEINGMTHAQTYSFVLDAYKRFNWTENYVPAMLRKRGFEPERMNEKMYHNYAWARDMLPMWETLRSFVGDMLKMSYKSDDEVARDRSVAAWCNEMQSSQGGQMPSFPSIKTMDALIDAVTMCIHIASPMHNSVNYLQCYYQSFVPAKPASLMAPLPRNIEDLMKYKEQDIIAALPVKDQRVWLLSSQLPYLLSYGVSEDQTLLAYAREMGNGKCMREGMCQKDYTVLREALCAKCLKKSECVKDTTGEMKCMTCLDQEHAMCSMDGECMHEDTCAMRGMGGCQCLEGAAGKKVAKTESCLQCKGMNDGKVADAKREICGECQKMEDALKTAKRDGSCMKDGRCTKGGMCLNEGACVMEGRNAKSTMGMGSIVRPQSSMGRMEMQDGMPATKSSSSLSAMGKMNKSCLKDGKCQNGGLCMEKGMCVRMSQNGSGMTMKEAAMKFEDNLIKLGPLFHANSRDMDDCVVAYNVMDPTELAVSVLI